MKSIVFTIPLLLVILIGCNNGEDQADAFGNFEAIEVIVSAESQGRILDFAAVEGTVLQQDQVAVTIDSTNLVLKKKQIQSGMVTLNSKIRTLDAQVEASRVQLMNVEREKDRIIQLFEGGAATSKQKDDINGQIALLKAQIKAAESQKASLFAERSTLTIQVQQVEDQISRCGVRNPVVGTLLTKFKEAGEIAVPGQPLYKVANLDELILRAYISGDQLSQLQTGASVAVRIDVPGGMEVITGEVSWISPQAEFTPKIIQTKEERINLVYAVKIRVPNDGRLKIGMPGEVLFH